jgi:hypothetical protein
MTNEAAASINDNINTAVLVHNKDDNNMKMQMQMKEHRDLLTSTGGVLCVFILEIYYLQEDSLNNASSLFKDVERDLTSAIVGGNLTLSILQSAQDASNKVLNNATVSVSASLAAMAKYGKYSSRVIYRRPTHAPTHSPLPTHTPTHSPTHRPSRETDDGDDGGSYSGPNKWLIVVCKDDTYMFILSSSSFFLKKKNFISQHAVLTIHGYYLFISSPPPLLTQKKVIAIELVISIGLCFCCIKVGRRNAEDPLELGQLVVKMCEFKCDVCVCVCVEYML